MCCTLPYHQHSFQEQHATVLDHAFDAEGVRPYEKPVELEAGIDEFDEHPLAHDTSYIQGCRQSPHLQARLIRCAIQTCGDQHRADAETERDVAGARALRASTMGL